jgi:hypothetical protein
VEVAIAIAAVVVLAVVALIFSRRGGGEAPGQGRRGGQTASWPKVRASITNESIRSHEDDAAGFYQVRIEFSFLEPVRDYYRSRGTLRITIHLPVAPSLRLLDVKKEALARAFDIFEERQPEPDIERGEDGTYYRVHFRCGKETAISTADGQHPEDGIELEVEVPESLGDNHAGLKEAASRRARALFKEAARELSR